jgi:hypothetical protein
MSVASTRSLGLAGAKWNRGCLIGDFSVETIPEVI